MEELEIYKYIILCEAMEENVTNNNIKHLTDFECF